MRPPRGWRESGRGGDEAEEEVLKRGRGRGINKGGDGEWCRPRPHARPRVSAHVVGGGSQGQGGAPRGADCVGCLGEVGDGWGKGIEIESTPPQMGGEGGGEEEEGEEREREVWNEAERRTTRTRDAMLLGHLFHHPRCRLACLNTVG